MNWIEVTVKVICQAQEIVTNIMYEAGAGGLHIEDTGDFDPELQTDEDGKYAERPLEAQEDRYINIKAYFPNDVGIHDKLSYIGERLKYIDKFCIRECMGEMRTAAVNDEDWAEQWKKYYKPVRIGKHIVVKPSWEAYAPEEKDIIIEMDPGAAFGTGTHETTQLCLRLLEKHVKTGSTALDMGCGTGILSIGCAKLGCTQVTAVDIDTLAVKTALENIRLNKVEDRVRVLHSDLLNRVNLNPVHIITANIEERTIRNFSVQAKDILQPDGIFIASGILKGRLDELYGHLHQNSLIIEEVMEQNEWMALCCRRIS